MERSILKTVVLYLSIQLVFIVATYSTGNVTSGTIAAYAAITIIVHAGLAAFLLRFREDFFNLSTSQPLTKINVANRITLLRISTLPSIALLLQHNEVFQIRIVLPALLVILFLTDSFDGQIARRGK
jgi:CDP-diacylglycerol--glycerol-3-phosphate 3-phosphatidyltransferase